MTGRPNAGEIAARLRSRIEDLAVDLLGNEPTMKTRSALRFYPKGGLVITTRGDRRGALKSQTQ